MLDILIEIIDRAPFAALNGVIRACRATSRRVVDRSKYVESVDHVVSGYTVTIRHYPNGVRCHAMVERRFGGPLLVSYVNGRPWRCYGNSAVIDVDHGVYVTTNASGKRATRLGVYGIGPDDFSSLVAPREYQDGLYDWICNDVPPSQPVAEYLVLCKKYGALATKMWLEWDVTGAGNLVL